MDRSLNMKYSWINLFIWLAVIHYNTDERVATLHWEKTEQISKVQTEYILCIPIELYHSVWTGKKQNPPSSVALFLKYQWEAKEGL
jgi:hypothetical protein